MELSQEDLRLVRMIPTLGNDILTTYVELWYRYRGLLHVLAAHGIGPAEQVERQIDEWIAAHQEDLFHEARRRLAQLRPPSGPRGAGE